MISLSLVYYSHRITASCLFVLPWVTMQLLVVDTSVSHSENTEQRCYMPGQRKQITQQDDISPKQNSPDAASIASRAVYNNCHFSVIFCDVFTKYLIVYEKRPICERKLPHRKSGNLHRISKMTILYMNRNQLYKRNKRNHEILALCSLGVQEFSGIRSCYLHYEECSFLYVSISHK